MKVEMEGLAAFVVKIENATKDIREQANRAVMEAAIRTAALARTQCQPLPEDDAEMAADIRAVAASINYVHDKENLKSAVYAGNVQGDDFAAWLEFGTGPHAAKYVKTIPIEFELYALTFYVNGKGTMKPHPYLVRPYIEEGKKLVDKLKGLRPVGFK